MTKTLILSEIFSAAHLYHQKDWSDGENAACFGKCFTKYGHGHNYRFEVGFTNPQGPVAALKTHVKAVTDLLDHQHLNFVIPEFKDVVPTTENIAQYLLKKLQERCPNESLSYIKLFEMDDLWVEIRL
ncbi:6-carboxytetrahydropterin synthase [Bdellovibrio sp. HCB337]|uniref:6-carboxytetrahydropterin synthase n=1 Tax=Bdellovibrio sp. HCB337 TaxID=3394358 RepID=UPI0039A578F6